jgi:hypothetical protein
MIWTAVLNAVLLGLVDDATAPHHSQGVVTVEPIPADLVLYDCRRR